VTGLLRTLTQTEKSPPSQTISEVRDLAMQLIRAFGERSTSYANHQALKARERGEGLHMTAWHWIAGATVEILRSDPDELSRR
jgi:hypothetical protein